MPDQSLPEATRQEDASVSIACSKSRDNDQADWLLTHYGSTEKLTDLQAVYEYLNPQRPSASSAAPVTHSVPQHETDSVSLVPSSESRSSTTQATARFDPSSNPGQVTTRLSDKATSTTSTHASYRYGHENSTSTLRSGDSSAVDARWQQIRSKPLAQSDAPEEDASYPCVMQSSRGDKFFSRGTMKDRMKGLHKNLTQFIQVRKDDGDGVTLDDVLKGVPLLGENRSQVVHMLER